MLILGQKYKFTDLELKRLQNKFVAIKNITYKDHNPLEVIETIKELLKDNNHKVIVLNTNLSSTKKKTVKTKKSNSPYNFKAKKTIKMS